MPWIGSIIDLITFDLTNAAGGVDLLSFFGDKDNMIALIILAIVGTIFAVFMLSKSVNSLLKLIVAFIFVVFILLQLGIINPGVLL